MSMRLSGLMASCRQIKQKVGSIFRSVPGKLSSARVINDTGGLQVNSRTAQDASISIAIPVKNAGHDFRLLLSLLKAQKGFKKLEIVIVDSGSSDRSVGTAEEFGAKVIKILPQEFSHSYARNLAAEHATGDYILFTVQDALPPSDVWLYELFSALKNKNVAAVSCAEYPRENADLFYRACCWGHYRFLEVDGRDRILSKPDTENYFTLRKNGALSDLACLIPRDLFLKYGFRGNFAEDLDLGMRLIKNGFKLAFLSSTKIIHSHNRPAYYHLKRGYVDALLLSELFPDFPILAIEPGRLLRDIPIVHRVMHSIVHEQLKQIAVPSSIADISSKVIDLYRGFPEASPPSTSAVARNGYVDVEFSAFVESLYDHHSLRWNSGYDGILLGAMQGVTKMILDYMDNAYEMIDDTVLEELESCLYKAFALQSGFQLGSCYFKGSAGTKKQLEKINRELTEGI